MVSCTKNSRSSKNVSDSTNSSGYNHSSGCNNSRNRSCSIISSLFFFCPCPLVGWLLAFSCCFLAFSSAFLALYSFLCCKASSLFCFFSALSIFLFSFSKSAIFVFSFCSNNAKLSSLVRSLALETDLFGAVGVVCCTECTR